MKKVKVTHVLRNGKELNSISGHTVPLGNRIYTLLGENGTINTVMRVHNDIPTSPK